MKPLRGCSGITKHACTQPWAISAQSSSNNCGIEAQKRSQVNRFQNQKQAMEKQESKTRFPIFPQPRRLRTITTYGIRILRARSKWLLADAGEGLQLRANTHPAVPLIQPSRLDRVDRRFP